MRSSCPSSTPPGPCRSTWTPNDDRDAVPVRGELVVIRRPRLRAFTAVPGQKRGSRPRPASGSRTECVRWCGTLWPLPPASRRSGESAAVVHEFSQRCRGLAFVVADSGVAAGRYARQLRDQGLHPGDRCRHLATMDRRLPYGIGAKTRIRPSRRRVLGDGAMQMNGLGRADSRSSGYWQDGPTRGW